MVYALIASAFVTVYCIFRLHQKDEQIQDLNERLIARSHSEYLTNTNQVPEEKEVEYEKQLSYFDALKVKKAE
ncbi:hypothetical protein ACFSGI_08990 [Paenibacillus nicotianae]|uniref:Uncharacterized protein n=1 Tax=Paenibacillus nicotianae TaxID=1526551 RepID=A0ABW4UR96_9BACL